MKKDGFAGMVVLAAMGICFFGGLAFAAEDPSLKESIDAHERKNTPVEESKNASMEKPTKESERVYEVFGMDCPACHGAVNKLIEKIPGVQKSKADWVKKQVAVTIKPGAQVTDDDVYDAIKRANFTPGKRIR